jgi:hypothetical protein
MRWFTLIALFTFIPTIVLAQMPQLDCHVGPLDKVYGGTHWLVYACNDNQTAVAVSAPGNPASPFYFILSGKGGKLQGEGTGDKSATDAAYSELSRLSNKDVLSLIEAAKKRR